MLAILLGVVGTTTSCQPDDPPCFMAAAWHEADMLFRNDSHWIGSDGAYSVDLGNDRSLWLFGDTWIDSSGQGTRKAATLIRNSVAIQSGRDPAKSTIKFFWKTTKQNAPQAFFSTQDSHCYWPGHGVRIHNNAIVFLNRLRKIDAGLGFESDGWTAVMIENPDEEPPDWIVTTPSLPADDPGVTLGFASVLEWEKHVYAFGSQDAVKSHPIHVARWPVQTVLEHDLTAPEWWAGSEVGWVRDASSMPGKPVFDDGQAELTIHFDDHTDQFIAIQTVGFGSANLAIRSAKMISGPWTPPRTVYQPPENNRRNIMIYAGKAHPQLVGADLVLTYATNTSRFSEHFSDDSIYYPRFLRLTRCQ